MRSALPVRSETGPIRGVVRFALLVSVALGSLAGQPATDWPARIRALVDAGRLDHAMGVVDEWMRTYPQDLDARAWHARLQAWSRHWAEAEAEYNALLETAPRDPDLLMGLADVLAWQNRHQEALPLLERACAEAPEREDCRTRKARALAALDDSRGHGRHELRIGAGVDVLNYAQNASTYGVALDSRWTRLFRSSTSLTRFNRFSHSATKLDGVGSFRLTSRDALTIGAGVAGDQAIVPRVEGQVEYGRGIDVPRGHFMRGVEAIYMQRWMWFRDARVAISAPGVVLYLPKDWQWFSRLSFSRVSVPGAEPDWRNGVLTRLTFPVRRRLAGHLLFASGMENFGTVDQVLLSVSRTGGGGVRLRVAPGQELHAFVYHQVYSQGRSMTSCGVSYAFRF